MVICHLDEIRAIKYMSLPVLEHAKESKVLKPAKKRGQLPSRKDLFIVGFILRWLLNLINNSRLGVQRRRSVQEEGSHPLQRGPNGG